MFAEIGMFWFGYRESSLIKFCKNVDLEKLVIITMYIQW